MEEILNAILPNVLEIIVTIISIVVARYAIPCIKEDLVPWLKEKRLYNTIKKFVQAVEKMAETGVIDKASKKQKVVELLKAEGIVITDTVNAFIESCVKELDLISSTIYEEIVEPEEIEEPEIIIETENI